MSEAYDEPGAFAIWDTVHDRFFADAAGEQCWRSVDEIELEADDHEGFIERVSLLVNSRP